MQQLQLEVIGSPTTTLFVRGDPLRDIYATMSSIPPAIPHLHSSAADSLNMPARLRSLVQAQKPEIRINFVTKKKTYTTLDRIEGTIAVTAPIDTPFDTLDIEFVGT